MDKRLKGDCQALSSKELKLREIIRESAESRGCGRAIIGFSGGVDSSLLLWEAVAALSAKNVLAVTAVSPTSCPGEEEAAREFARVLQVEHLVIPTKELDDPLFVSNPTDRCYVCKRIRYETIYRLVEDLNGAVIFDGSQADDDPNDRPGMRALNELGIDAPLLKANLRKAEVRQLLRLARHSKLAQKIAQPCLATRIPTGQPITLNALAMISKGEAILKECGFKIVRLRHHFPIARIVTDRKGISKILRDVELREHICRSLRDLGYKHIAVDLEEYGL